MTVVVIADSPAATVPPNQDVYSPVAPTARRNVRSVVPLASVDPPPAEPDTVAGGRVSVSGYSITPSQRIGASGFTKSRLS